MSILQLGDPALHSVFFSLWHYGRFAATALAVSLLVTACDGQRGNPGGEGATARLACVVDSVMAAAGSGNGADAARALKTFRHA